jgi:hypothetical protein
MTSAGNTRDAGFGSRAADSAKCLLVVGGYQDNANVLRPVVAAAKERILMSPSLGDFFQLRFVDMGPQLSDVSAGVAKLVLELTNRPTEAARNFSALMIIDQSVAAIDRVLRKCEADNTLTELKVRFHGSASNDDRKHGQELGAKSEIVIAGARRPSEELVGEIVRYATNLLSDFGSGWEPGLPVQRVDQLGVAAQSELRGVVQAAARAEAEASHAARTAEERRAEERLRERDAERQREAERRGKGERKGEERDAVAERQVNLGKDAESSSENAIRLKTEAELKDEAERRAREAELRIIEAHYEAKLEAQRRELEAELRAERARAAALDNREPSVDPELTSAESSGEQPPADSAQPPVDPVDAGSRPADDGASTEAVQADQQGPAPSLAQRNPARTLANLAGSGASRLSRFRGRSGKQAAPAAGPDEEVTLLLERLARTTNDDPQAFSTSLVRLRARADAPISDRDRQRCRDIVLEYGLLRRDLPLGSSTIQFYDLLLRLVYGLPLDYLAYCEVEDLSRTAESGPPRALLEAISAGREFDIRVMAIARYRLGPDRLFDWFRRDRPSIERLISALAGEWARPDHAHVMYELTLRYFQLLRSPYDQYQIRAALRARGYLAAALRSLYPESIAGQVTVLTEFLQAAYPTSLDRLAVTEIFAVGEPTPALVRAVLRLLGSREDDRAWALGLVAGRLVSPLGDTNALDDARKARLVEMLTAEREELSEGR